ncbi:NAD(P)/FAD-dependent oxidoreductase [Chryseomicrobium palamuruense]|uniref:Ferredoxin--NADP reductase n=1 Tax=Chryseomicrobium palamuruense TaxID=682973 RepID=A0ABV8UT65_9BACL
MRDVFDITIIGAGPAGLYSAFYSGLRGLKTKILDAQQVLGGKLNVYMEKMVWDVGGQPPLPAAQLIEQLVKQAKTFHPTIHLSTKVTRIERLEDETFCLHTDSGEKHYSKTIVMALGSGILKPQKLAIEGADRYEVSNLHYVVKSLRQFEGRHVVISGGGNAAIDWANELAPLAASVTVVYRKEAFTGAHEAQIEQLLNSGVKCLFNTTICKLIADAEGQAIDRVEVKDELTGDKSELTVDEVIINHGYEIDADLLQNSSFDFELDEYSRVIGSDASETSVPGIFAAGDILIHSSKVNLIAGCFHDAANAVNRAKLYIEPTAEKVAMVSSHNEIFKEKNKELLYS